MPIIDAHIHLYPEEVNRDPAGWASAQGEDHWATLCTRVRAGGQPVQGFPSVDDLLWEMDEAAVERGVLLGWYWSRPETCVLQNRFYADCVKQHPDRLSAFATFHPAAGLALTIDEITRAHESGLMGLGELSPHSQRIAVDNPVLAEALSLAGKLKMPVNVHVTEPESRAYPGKVSTPLEDFLSMAKAHPATTFILAHWGGRLPLVAGQRLPDNIYYDTAASPLLYDQTIWRKFVSAVGNDQVIFGSDYPLNLYPSIDPSATMSRLVAEVHRSELTAAELKPLLSENFRRLVPSGAL